MRNLTTITAAIALAVAVTPAVALNVDTTVDATVDNEIVVSNVPTSVDFGAVNPAGLVSTASTSAASNVEIYDNSATSNIQVQTTSTKFAPSGTGVASLPEGMAVIADGTPAAGDPEKMIPISMVCTPCQASGSSAPSAIGFSPAGSAATNPGGTGSSVSSDTGGVRTIVITNEYSSVAACTDGSSTKASCTFALGPTTDYTAESGTYSGQLSQVYSTTA